MAADKNAKICDARRGVSPESLGRTGFISYGTVNGGAGRSDDNGSADRFF